MLTKLIVDVNFKKMEVILYGWVKLGWTTLKKCVWSHDSNEALGK